MNDEKKRVEAFEANRAHLRTVGFRLLGSMSEADDVVQECWLRYQRADTTKVENLRGWLTTVVSRLSLDHLRARIARREDSLGVALPEALRGQSEDSPSDELLMMDSVGVALLVVLERLAPAERLAFVLHDVFAMPFDEIAPVVGRSLAATRKLASRARQQVQGTATVPDADLSKQREVVTAFIHAARTGDLKALLALLDPDVVRRADDVARTRGGPREIRGAAAVAAQARGYALANAQVQRFTQIALIDGHVGIVVAPKGQLRLALCFEIRAGKIVELDVIGSPARLRDLTISNLGEITVER
jgi:RNA polymerase sigma-70 factor (ECF subfamily)